jgi:DNA (cytosine-5)-methyltransferase 1
MGQMTHGSLFSGIGGFDLASEWMGWDNLFHCEWNDFGQTVLKHYWPNAHTYDDITKSDFTIWNGRIDVLTGGFPCQPYSQVGKRLGKEDDRHLWPEMLRAIREIQPRWVVGENVLGLVNWNGGLVFDEVQADVEAQGYKVQPYVLPACAVNAPHKRDRVWFVAYADNARLQEKRPKQQTARLKQYRKLGRSTTDTTNTGVKSLRPTRENAVHGYKPTTNTESRRQTCEEYRKEKPRRVTKESVSDYWQNFPTQSPIFGRDDGLPTELDGITFSKWRQESIKAYGNAIVPQVAHQIFKAIEQYDSGRDGSH